jgi:hypothetical protein
MTPEQQLYRPTFNAPIAKRWALFTVSLSL